MTSMEPKDDEQPKPDLQQVATVATEKVKGQAKTNRLIGALLNQGGLGARKATVQNKENRADEAKAEKKKRDDESQSLSHEFWKEFDYAEFAFGKRALDHFALSDTQRHDQETIDFFPGDDPRTAAVEWLKKQPRNSFKLVAAENEGHGPSIWFEVHFLSTKRPRRNVGGYMQRGEKAEGNRYMIAHIGPAQ